MSWNPLKKFGKPQRTLQTHSNDVDLENYVTKLEQLEQATVKLHKDAKKYEELVLETTKNEQKITKDLSCSVLCQEEDTLRELVEEWFTFANGVSKPDEELVANVHQAVVEPVKKFQAFFPEVKFALRKYEQAQQDCVRIQAKVARSEQKESTGTNVVKLDHAKHSLRASMNNVKCAHASLKEELPQVHEKRIEYFQPIIEALIRAEVNHWGEMTHIFADVIQGVPKQFSADELQQKRLREIQSLSIVAGM